ncbi:GH25 family lysozyme [Flexivirga alba]|uniref:GH25 family lysozyme n=1 Tax=Flexivirga alba TaxID=702742 RepID=A0ABW2ACY3_9MICO
MRQEPRRVSVESHEQDGHRLLQLRLRRSRPEFRRRRQGQPGRNVEEQQRGAPHRRSTGDRARHRRQQQQHDDQLGEPALRRSEVRLRQGLGGSTWTDPTFSRNYNGARSAGIIRGAYHFANPAGASGKTQADFFISHGGAWRADGYTLPGALDVEGSCYSKTPAAMVTWIKAFVAEYKLKEGRTPVIYTNRAWWQDCTGNSTAFHSSALWFAHPTTVGTLPGGWTKQTIWQYGASGGIDQNKFNGSATALKAFANNS